MPLGLRLKPKSTLSRRRIAGARGSTRELFLPTLHSEDSESGANDLATAVLAAETNPASADFFHCGGADLIGRLKREL
jgi:hypothetical protein